MFSILHSPFGLQEIAAQKRKQFFIADCPTAMCFFYQREICREFETEVGHTRTCSSLLRFKHMPKSLGPRSHLCTLFSRSATHVVSAPTGGFAHIWISDQPTGTDTHAADLHIRRRDRLSRCERRCGWMEPRLISDTSPSLATAPRLSVAASGFEGEQIHCATHE